MGFHSEKTKSVLDVDSARPKRRSWRFGLKDLIYGRGVVNLRPSLKRRRPWVVFVAAGAVFIFSMFVMGKFFTRAAVLDAYPSTCLGDWQNPGNAQDKPETFGDPNSAFSTDNSAVGSGSSTQIFCGGFSLGDIATSSGITNVGLTLVWQVGEPATSSADTSSTSFLPSKFFSMIVPAAHAQEDAAAPAPDVPPPPDASAAPAPPAPPAPATDTTAPADPTPSSDNSSATTVVPADNTPPADVAPPASDTTPAAPAEVTPATVVDASSSDNVATSSDASFVPQSIPVQPPDENFLDVNYSTDGQTWVELEKVSVNNWPNLTLTIPVASWEDLQNLQIRVTAIPTTQSPIPPVYLDGMFIEVHYDYLSVPGEDNTTVQATSSNPTPAPLPATAKLPPPPPRHQYAFAVNGVVPADVRDMQWISAGDSKAYNDELARQSSVLLPVVSLAGGNALQLSGSCTEDYYTLLIFARADDYRTDPASAVFNHAYPCTNGKFSRTITDMELPSSLAGGMYYLMVANQALKGPWVPYPVLYPITLADLPPSP